MQFNSHRQVENGMNVDGFSVLSCFINDDNSVLHFYNTIIKCCKKKVTVALDGTRDPWHC